MSNSEEQVKILIELQKFDTQIFRLEDELKAIPERLSELEKAFSDKSANLKIHEDNIKALQLKRKEKEGELQAKEETVKKYTSQMYQVKTNKEYSTLHEEIDRVKADSSVIEEGIINIFDQVDAENKQVSEEKEILKKEEAALNEEKKKLAAAVEQIKTELCALKVQRSGLAEGVDKKILARYERILGNKDGLAVVPIVKESCQGCFARMPAQVINEVRMKIEIVCCEQCTRMLYIEE